MILVLLLLFVAVNRISIIGDGKVNQDIKYKYFLLGSNNFFKTHIEDGKLADNGMKFVYPILSKEDYIKEK